MIIRSFMALPISTSLHHSKIVIKKHIKLPPWKSDYGFHISIPQGECTFQTVSNSLLFNSKTRYVALTHCSLDIFADIDNNQHNYISNIITFYD
jgi:hypothetical protein